MSSLLAAGYNLTSGQFNLLSKILYDDATGDIDADGALTVGTFVQLKDYAGSSPSPSVGGALWAEKPGSNDEIWFYDGTGTVNTRLLDTNYSLAGDVTGVPGSTSVDKLQGYAVQDHAPEDGEPLVWISDNVQYEPGIAGPLKISTYSHTLDSGDLKAGEIDINISAVTLLDVRLLDVCTYSPTAVLKSYSLVEMAFVLYVYIYSTTEVNVLLGEDAGVGDIINLIIGEVIRGEE